MWLKQVMGVEKPIIGMVHLPAMPGSPLYDEEKGINWIVERTEQDLIALQDGGIDAIMFCNENDRPYVFSMSKETMSTMAAVIGQLKTKIRVPFGVDLLWDPLAALAVAKATGASFIREVLTGTYSSDMGLWTTNAGEALRYRKAIGAGHIKILFNINAEFASSLDRRQIADIAKSVVFSSVPDAICVSGAMTGSEVAKSDLEAVKEVVGDTPIIVNTGVRKENVLDKLAIANGAIVGTGLKVDGITWNPVDPLRVKAFMEHVKQARESLQV